MSFFLYSKKALIAVFALGIIAGVAGTGAVSAAIKGSVIFNDVPAGAFYDDAVGELYGLGIVRGKSVTSYDPNGNVTRGEVAVLLKRLRDELKGNVVTGSSSSSRSSVSSSSSVNTSTTAGTLKLTTSTFAIIKTAKQVSFTVQRIGGTKGKVTVHYMTVDGSAKSGTDYTKGEGTIEFADGEDIRSVNIGLTGKSSVDDYNKEFSIKLDSPTGGAALGSPSELKVTLLDTLGNNPASSSSSSSTSTSGGSSSSSSSSVAVKFDFNASIFSVMEDAGNIAITVRRSGSSSSSATVNFATRERTADSGTHYTDVNGTLTFNSGESTKTFSVPVISRTPAIDGNKTFDVLLSSPSAGTSLGTQTSAIVTIIDKDASGTFGSGTVLFTQEVYTANAGSTAIVTVNRQQTFNNTTTVQYTTTDQSALTNADYTPTSGTLTFLPGEVSKSFPVTILSGATSAREIGLTLSNISGGVFGSPFLARIRIQ